MNDAKSPPEGRRTGLLRLYVAGSTPNSARAESNLLAAIKELDGDGERLELEIVDVFSHPKRALTDGVIVTPTLIGIVADGRKTMMGDLTDSAKLKLLLTSMQDAKADKVGLLSIPSVPLSSPDGP